MIVLITNDDGFGSDGIKILKGIALNFASEVWVVAPDRDRSGSAVTVTLKSLFLKQYAEREFSLSGTPATCVIIALSRIMQKKPDLVLSGVNVGSNVGDDIYHSGTVGAAMACGTMSIPAIALSQSYNTLGSINWQHTENFAQKIITKLVEVGWPQNVAMNVNFPSTEEVNGIKFTAQGRYNTSYEAAFVENSDGSFNLDWSRTDMSGSGCVDELNNGFITITPIKFKSDVTDYDVLNTMIGKKIF